MKDPGQAQRLFNFWLANGEDFGKLLAYEEERKSLEQSKAKRFSESEQRDVGKRRERFTNLQAR